MIQNKVNKTPQIVSTINKINIADMMNEERVKDIKSKDRMVQTAAQFKRSNENNQKKSQIKALDEINSQQLSAKSRKDTGKKDSKKKSHKKNKIILEELDKIDKDLGIMDDFGGDAEEGDDIRVSKLIDRPQSNLVGKRPVSGLSIGT